MNRCTVCGATSREGAKFCTSCGTPLGEEQQPDTVEHASDQPESTAVTSTGVADARSSGTDDEEPSASPSSGAGDAERPDITTTRVEIGARPAADSDDPGAGDDSGTRAEGNAEDPYASSWPGPSRATDDDEAEPAVSQPTRPVDEGTGNFWPGPVSRDVEVDDDDEDDVDHGERVVSSPAPRSFATDADQEPDRNDERADDDHHGPSDWEGWSPTASGPSTGPGAVDERLETIRRLAEDLKRQVDRIVHPADLGSRDLNPDDLADQLERWSRAVPDSDELLEAVKEVRRSPRDIDALVRLADRAPDLELLVRHYQSITSMSDQWSEQLRRSREGSSDA